MIPIMVDRLMRITNSDYWEAGIYTPRTPELERNVFVELRRKGRVPIIFDLKQRGGLVVGSATMDRMSEDGWEFVGAGPLRRASWWQRLVFRAQLKLMEQTHGS